MSTNANPTCPHCGADLGFAPAYPLCANCVARAEHNDDESTTPKPQQGQCWHERLGPNEEALPGRYFQACLDCGDIWSTDRWAGWTAAVKAFALLASQEALEWCIEQLESAPVTDEIRYGAHNRRDALLNKGEGNE